MPCAFDRACQYTLMFGTGASLPARANLSLFSDQTPEDIRLFIVYGQMLVCTKLTYFRSSKIPAFTALVHIIFIA